MPAEADHADDTLKAALCLGNPGRAYRDTRHNLGYMVADRIAASEGAPRFRRRYKSYYTTTALAGHDIVLAKPRTYMNDSGRAATAVCHAFQIHLADLIVVCDDINLPLGKLRFRAKGSSGGHRGLESIAAALGSTDFARLRIGIGAPGRRDQRDYVLDAFTEDETALVDEAVGRAVEGLRVWIDRGIREAMNAFN